MIDAVVLKLNPELVKAIAEAAESDNGCLDTTDALMHDESGFWLHVEPEMASDWCQSWFAESELEAYMKTQGRMLPGFRHISTNQLVQGFMEVILKIYRLTQSV